MSQSKTITRHRRAAFNLQSGRCYYCSAPMWLHDRRSFAAKFGLTRAIAADFRCTAEHVIARQDGGTDDEANIVAACRSCNHGRHAVPHAAPPAEEYRRHVQARGS